MKTIKKDDLQEKLEAAQHQQDKKMISDDSSDDSQWLIEQLKAQIFQLEKEKKEFEEIAKRSQYEYINPVSYTHLRAHETPEHLVCREAWGFESPPE